MVLDKRKRMFFPRVNTSKSAVCHLRTNALLLTHLDLFRYRLDKDEPRDSGRALPAAKKSDCSGESDYATADDDGPMAASFGTPASTYAEERMLVTEAIVS
jgi:hypothetical protein